MPLELTVLGSGTFLPDADRSSAAWHLRTSSASVLVDCGPGTLHGLDRWGVDWRGLTHLLISHYHTDHVGDVAALMFALKNAVGADRTEPLRMVGPPGFRRFLEGLASALGSHVLDPRFPAEVVEVEPGRGWHDPEADLRVEACRTPHTDESLAYRVGAEGSWVGYTGDTGPSAEVAGFLAGCDLVLAECAWTDEDPKDGHLTPARVAGLAEVARPGVLLLTHVYPPVAPEEAAEAVRRRWGGRVVAAVDGMRARRQPGGWSVDPSRPSP